MAKIFCLCKLDTPTKRRPLKVQEGQGIFILGSGRILVWMRFVKLLELTCLKASLPLLNWQVRCNNNARTSCKEMTLLHRTWGRVQSSATDHFASSLVAKNQQLSLQRTKTAQTTKLTHSSVVSTIFGVRLRCLERIAQLTSKLIRCKVGVNTKQDVENLNS